MRKEEDPLETIDLTTEIQTLLNQEAYKEKILELVGPLQPYDISEIVRTLDHEEQLRLMEILPADVGAESLEYLEPEIQYRILHHLRPDVAKPLLTEMGSDAVVDLLLSIHPNQAATLKEWLPPAYRERIDTLMTFPENTAGSLATVDYIAVREGWTVGRTLEHIRKVAREAEVVTYTYVVDAQGRLIDVVSLRELILADPETRLSELVTHDVISVGAYTDQEEAARILAQYGFLALPVVDHQDRLIGIISVEDLFDVVEEEATEDFYRMGGSEPLVESYFRTPVRVLYRKRIVWLLVLFIAQAYTSTVLRLFEETLSQVVALTFFIPLLIGTGGNTGSQTVTTLVRGLAVGEIGFKDMGRVLGKELLTGTLLGATLAVATWIRAYILGVSVELAPVVAVTALFIVIWASTVAAVLPLLLHRLRLDPAVVSGPFITTVVDGTGLFMYFTIAKMFLGI